MESINPVYFDWSTWRRFDSSILNIPHNYYTLTSNDGKRMIKKYAIGYCEAEKLICRPKLDHMAIMFEKDGENCWTHITDKEFSVIFGEKI